MHSIWESLQLLTNVFATYKAPFPKQPKRPTMSPGFATLLSHAVWTAFFDRCLIKWPTSERISLQYGGVWTLESSSLVDIPTTSIALSRTVRGDLSYASGLIPIPEEWLVERDTDWYIVNHWEDQFCREAYQKLCIFDEMQHLRTAAMVLLGATPSVCTVSLIMDSDPTREPIDYVTVDSLDPCARKHLLSHESLATFRLRVRSDVMRSLEAPDVTFGGYRCQAKLHVYGCGFKPTLSSKKVIYGGTRKNTVMEETRMLLIPEWALQGAQPAA